MPFETKRFSVWTRLYERLLLEPTAGTTTPSVSELIVPTVDADQLLTTPTITNTAGVNISAAAGTEVAFHTVPRGEEWVPHYANKPGTTGNTTLIVVVGGVYQTLSVNNSAAIESFEFKGGLTLREGDYIGLFTTGNGADTSVAMRAWYDRIDLGE